MTYTVRILALLLGLVVASMSVYADVVERLPKWELAAGLAAANFPDYPGSDQNQNLVLPYPSVTYRGSRIRAGRDGLRGMLFKGNRWDLDVSAGGSLSVNSEDNRAREGMNDLGISLELGPSLRLKFIDQADQKLQLRFNLRALLVADDFPVLAYEGWLLNPELRWRRHHGERYILGGSLDFRYANRGYHDHFYGVASQFASATRPEYQGQRGYSSMGLNGFVTMKLDQNWRASVRLGYYDLHAVAFNDSPLFRKNSSAFFGLSISRVLWRSEATVGPARIDDITL